MHKNSRKRTETSNSTNKTGDFAQIRTFPQVYHAVFSARGGFGLHGEAHFFAD